MELARSVTRSLCEAIGDSDRMWSATARLARASGMPDPDNAYQVMAALEREGPRSTLKLWDWLVAAATRGNETGDHDVPAMAFYWATNWIHRVEPTLSGGAQASLGFGKAPAGTHAALVGEARRALAVLPDDFVVASTAEPAVIRCGILRLLVEEQASSGGEMSLDAAIQRVQARG